MLVIAGRHSMSKIRINELARELEVKPNIILDLLPELGVTDKKTHSSSLDDDVALQIRQRVASGAFGEPAEPVGEGREHAAQKEQRHEAAAHAPAIAPEAARPAPSSIAKSEPTPIAEEAPKEPAPAVGLHSAPVRPAFPLRPPLASGQPSPTGPGSPSNRGPVIPSRPAPPAPKPGQIISGPRQPLPPGLADLPKSAPGLGAPSPAIPPAIITTPGAPGPGVVPAIPTRPLARSGPAAPAPGTAPAT